MEMETQILSVHRLVGDVKRNYIDSEFERPLDPKKVRAVETDLNLEHVRYISKTPLRLDGKEVLLVSFDADHEILVVEQFRAPVESE